jgi:hypothetical protein
MRPNPNKTHNWREQPHDHEVESRARIAPALVTVVLLAAVWIGKPLLFWMLVPLALMGAVSGRHPIDVIYSELLAPLFGMRALPRCGAPRRFASTIAGVSLTATALAFELGFPLLGGALGGLLAASMFVTASADSCVPCYVFVKVLGPKRIPAPRMLAHDEPTLVMSTK